MMENVRFVLVNTSHPGNIGAAARAMKNMALKDLYLVAPKKYPDDNAYEMASGALDLLGKAKVVASVKEAIADCELVIGTSARSRSLPWPMLSPRAFAEKAALESTTKIAVLFGRENSGLTNEELQLCNYHLEIPSNPSYSSLNLAQAVQVVAYELRVAATNNKLTPVEKPQYALQDDMQNFYDHLEKTLIDIDFLDLRASKKLIPRLHRMFNRIRLEKTELNILRGILSSVGKLQK